MICCQSDCDRQIDFPSALTYSTDTVTVPSCTATTYLPRETTDISKSQRALAAGKREKAGNAHACFHYFFDALQQCRYRVRTRVLFQPLMRSRHALSSWCGGGVKCCLGRCGLLRTYQFREV